jgi:hypothetical protein
MATQSNKILIHNSLGCGGTGANVFSKLVAWGVMEKVKVLPNAVLNWLNICSI